MLMNTSNLNFISESRRSLLDWLNSTIKSNYIKIEQLGNGVAYCFLYDSIFGDFPLSKLKTTPSTYLEYVNNYKLLQASFNKHKINKEIPIEHLIKNNFRDNYNMLVWFKSLHSNYASDETQYDFSAKLSIPDSSKLNRTKSTPKISSNNSVVSTTPKDSNSIGLFSPPLNATTRRHTPSKSLPLRSKRIVSNLKSSQLDSNSKSTAQDNNHSIDQLKEKVKDLEKINKRNNLKLDRISRVLEDYKEIEEVVEKDGLIEIIDEIKAVFNNSTDKLLKNNVLGLAHEFGKARISSNSEVLK